MEQTPPTSRFPTPSPPRPGSMPLPEPCVPPQLPRGLTLRTGEKRAAEPGPPLAQTLAYSTGGDYRPNSLTFGLLL